MLVKRWWTLAPLDVNGNSMICFKVGVSGFGYTKMVLGLQRQQLTPSMISFVRVSKGHKMRKFSLQSRQCCSLLLHHRILGKN